MGLQHTTCCLTGNDISSPVTDVQASRNNNRPIKHTLEQVASKCRMAILQMHATLWIRDARSTGFCGKGIGDPSDGEVGERAKYACERVKRSAVWQSKMKLPRQS